MPLHPVRRVPNVRAQKQQVCQLLRLPFIITTVQLLLFQSRSLLLEEFGLSKVTPQNSPLLFHFYSQFETLLHTSMGKEIFQSGRPSLSSGQSLTMLAYLLTLPLCGVSCCDLNQKHQHLHHLHLQPGSVLPPHSRSLLPQTHSLFCIFCFFSMGHCHWCKNMYQYSPVVNKPFSDPMSFFNYQIFLLSFSANLSQGVDTFTALFLHLASHFFISHAL